MLVRLYSSGYVGSGLSREDPERLALCDLAPGVAFDALHCHQARRGLAFIAAPQGVHDTLYADRIANPGRVVYMTPLITVAQFRVAIDAPLRSLPTAFRSAMRERLLPEEFDLSLVSLDWTLRRCLGAVSQHYFQRQRRLLGNREDTVPDRWVVQGEEFAP